jgi:Tyrosyl-tRNA synthetase C-terminal domain
VTDGLVDGHLLLEDKVMIIRRGKSNIRIVELVRDENYENDEFAVHRDAL